MGKFISISVALVLQIISIFFLHIYFSNNPRKIAIVVESAYGLNSYKTAMDEWIDNYISKSRYEEINFGTDKVLLGEGSKNIDSMFRVSFGKLDIDNLDKLYPKTKYFKRYFLSFSDNNITGNWNIIEFK